MDVDKVLSAQERQGLLLSVGTHRGKRSLSPVEVATLFAKILAAGGSLSDCARAARLEGTTMVGRFLRLLKLPESVRHLVDWGTSPGMIGPSAGSELARLEDAAEEEEVVKGVLTYRLSGSEVRQVVQLRKRSKRPVDDCLNEVVGMRPRIEKRYVYVGAVTSPALKGSLGSMTQRERDEFLAGAIRGVLDVKSLAVIRLGPDRFTLVGGASFGEAMTQKKDSLEQEINDALLRAKR
ncbi:MAG: hypothetical protein AB7P22_00800 [Vicinamibacterales bacterium]